MAKLVQKVGSAILVVGINPQVYCGHSFRIGIATTAEAIGVEDCRAWHMSEFPAAVSQSLIKKKTDTKYWAVQSSVEL